MVADQFHRAAATGRPEMEKSLAEQGHHGFGALEGFLVTADHEGYIGRLRAIGAGTARFPAADRGFNIIDLARLGGGIELARGVGIFAFRKLKAV